MARNRGGRGGGNGQQRNSNHHHHHHNNSSNSSSNRHQSNNKPQNQHAARRNIPPWIQEQGQPRQPNRQDGDVHMRDAWPSYQPTPFQVRGLLRFGNAADAPHEIRFQQLYWHLEELKEAMAAQIASCQQSLATLHEGLTKDNRIDVEQMDWVPAPRFGGGFPEVPPPPAPQASSALAAVTTPPPRFVVTPDSGFGFASSSSGETSPDHNAADGAIGFRFDDQDFATTPSSCDNRFPILSGFGRSPTPESDLYRVL